MSVSPPPFGIVLRATPPDCLVEATDEYLRRWYGVQRSEVLLADYQISGLWPVLGVGELAAGFLKDRGAAARCFSSQRTAADPLGSGARAHIPLTAWGERVGVLVFDLAELPTETDLDNIGGVADELAVALRAADRDTDRYRRTRRRERLTMAAELQWDLLPGRSLAHDCFLLAGQLEPAYAICGDHFDWSVTGDRLTITVLNGHDTGLAAAMLTNLAVNAMRNARRSGGDIVEQAELASDTVFAHHGGRHHVATLLLDVDLVSGVVEAVEAGSPQAYRLRGTEVSPILLEDQLPLGMFGEASYSTQRFRLEPGDRMFVVSDGVHAAAPGDRPAYGEAGLVAGIRGTRLQPATEAVGTVMRGLQEHHQDADPEDDAVIICLDWRGRNSPGE